MDGPSPGPQHTRANRSAVRPAFNHHAADDAEAEYDRLRDLARSEAAKRSSCFDRVGSYAAANQARRP